MSQNLPKEIRNEIKRENQNKIKNKKERNFRNGANTFII